MRLPGLLAAAGLLGPLSATFDAVHAQQPQRPRQPPKVVRSDPSQTLPSGAQVFDGEEFPANHGGGSAGGVIRLKPLQGKAAASEAGGSAEPGFEGILVQPRDDEPPIVDLADHGKPNDEVEVDLSLLASLTEDNLEVDLGDQLGPVTFTRDKGYDEAHLYGTADGTLGGPAGNPAGNSGTSRRKRRQRLRRVQSLAGDSLCNILGPSDVDPSLCEQTVDVEEGIDYTPNNAYGLPQRFEYFEGTGFSVVDGELVQSSIYIKKLSLTTVDENGEEVEVEYLSGYLNTPYADHTFRGDPVDGKTYVSTTHPEEIPGMPQPLTPEEEGAEMFDELDGTGLPLAPLAEGDGRRRNLRSETKEEDGFHEQIDRQVRRYLEEEQRRGRRLQDDEGHVVDIMVAYTRNALCEENNVALGSSCDAFDAINPASHQAAINKAEAAVAHTNLAYINSNIDLQLRLVYTHFTPDVDDSQYDCGGLLHAFRVTNDGVMDEVHSLRNAWGADMVALLGSRRVSGCGGIAYVGHGSTRWSYAHVMFSMTISSWATYGVFAHEVGHNFGCWHDRDNSGNANDPFAYGWQDPLGRFRTIMAYSQGCPSPCPRIDYFSSSDPTVLWNGLTTGNALNDCARKHNEVRTKVAQYRNVRVTFAPTKSVSPSASAMPSEGPTPIPTASPTGSRSPSLAPTLSLAPSGAPSDWPTFGNGELANYHRVDSPGTTIFHLRHGIMFDVSAKEHDITIHNFAIPFGRGGDMKISVWTQEDGGFWYEKNNKAAWTWRGTPDAYSPGITLEDPVALAWRGSEDGGYFGIDPIYIPAGTTKGIYIAVNSTGEDNLIGMYNTDGSSCEADWVEPHAFSKWFENDDVAVSEGVYKNNVQDGEWPNTSYGSAHESYRFIGSLYYESAGRTLAPATPRPTLQDTPAPGPPEGPVQNDEETFVRVDEALLKDMLEQYVHHEPTQCTGQADATSFTFDFPGTNDQSAWYEDFVQYEEGLFEAMMSHTDDAGTKDWQIRIGSGGNIYSLFANEMFGEAFPPQKHDNAPWIDEVQQMVSVNGQLNSNGAFTYDDYCTTAADNSTTCASYFHHQAGAYQRDSPDTDTPFFSPSLARHCEGNVCLFASWGTQAHVPTPFTSPIMYLNKYTNCGNGIIEHTQVIHNFAPEGSAATGAQGTDQTYFNVGWGGVRSSTLPYALEAEIADDSLSYKDPDTVDYLPICRWGQDDASAGRGRRIEPLSNTAGYTTFVQDGLQINEEVPEARTWCRDPSDNGCTDATTCMKPCTDDRLHAGWTPIELEIPPGGPSCEYHNGRDGKVSLYCNLRTVTGFGQTTPYLSGGVCAPWQKIAFQNSATNETLDVYFVRHWSWGLDDTLVYFSTFIDDDGQGKNGPAAQEGIELVNGLFQNDGDSPIPINVLMIGNSTNTATPIDYSPESLGAFTYVYGRDGEHDFGGRGRRRLGSTSQGVGSRDYTVFTLNWLGGRLRAGETYTNRGYFVVSTLGEAETTAKSLRDEVIIDKVQLEEYTPRRVSIYSEGSAFAVIPAQAAQESSAPCARSTSAVLECSGFSTPQAGHVAFFHITCGSSSYIGPDPYHFSPDFGASFPFHGTTATPVRSYVCKNDASVRPAWRLIGFVDAASPGCDADNMATVAALTHDEGLCDGTPTPTGSPSTSSAPSRSQVPSQAPSISSAPSTSLVPSAEVLEELGSSPSTSFDAVDGFMFEVHAKTQNIVVRNFEMIVFAVDTTYAREMVEVTVYSTPGSFYDANAGDGKDPYAWIDRGTFMVEPSPSLLEPSLLPENSWQPITVHQGESMGFYITLKDPLRKRKIFSRQGTALLADDIEDDFVLVRQGLGKQWDPCLGWGGTYVDTSLNPKPLKLAGSSLEHQDPTSMPSVQHSSMPSVSSMPVFSNAPSLLPSTSAEPSLMPSQSPSEADMKVSAKPSAMPSFTPAPTHELMELLTPGIENQQLDEGSSGDGVMFDITALGACEIYSITFGRMSDFPMTVHVYTRAGSHYFAYDDSSQWELIQTYTDYTFATDPEEPRRISFPPQYLAAGDTRAFYIAIVAYEGDRPLHNALLLGTNYLHGVWAQDERITIYEGLKFFGISEERPFGEGTESSGPFNLQGPGGISYNMKDAVIRYRPIDTIAPSVSPSVSQVPSHSQSPSINPTASKSPSVQPSTSVSPTPIPTGKPSVSIQPSESPSKLPSGMPSFSSLPSLVPSTSTRPSSMPSSQPSSQPSHLPSESPSLSSKPSSQPSSSPSESPSISSAPSFMPSVSVAPSLERHELVVSGPATGLAGAQGIMFDIVPSRALTVETFWVRQFGGTNTFTFDIYTKSNSWATAPTSEAAWEKIGESITVTTSDALVRIPHSSIDPVTVYAGQRQSFFIAVSGWYVAVRSESAGSSTTNGEVTLHTGHRKFDPNNRWAQGTTWYTFQGKMLYSYSTDPPSSVPSAAPSGIPSLAPSMAPTTSAKPSLQPSAQPSKLPSTQPTSSAAPSTTSAPSVNSPEPSLAPSRSVMPSSEPTPFPTASPTVMPTDTPTVSGASIQITIPSSISVSGFELPQTELQIETIIEIVGPTLTDLIRTDLRSDQRLKEVNIISINGVLVEPGTETFFRRRLQSGCTWTEDNTSLCIEYEILLEELCESDHCYNAEDVANTLYDQVTTDMQQEIDSGVFELELEKTALSNQIVLDLEVDNPNFEELAVLVLALLSSWYPTWKDGSYCENDGGEPKYMRLNQDEWMYPNRDGCCSRYYSYSYAACMGLEDEGFGFYPAWDGAESKCLHDKNAPAYMRNSPASWMYDSAEECCSRYYDWDSEACQANSDEGTSYNATSSEKWYVNHVEQICQQDCPTESGAACGGPADSWKETYDSALECCENRLSWVSPHVCETKSSGMGASGTSLWYVDWQQETCVRDCTASSSDSTCGGIVLSSHVDLHSSAEACCSDKLSWVPSEMCIAKSTNSPVATAESDQWYVDHQLYRCVKNCDSGDSSCGGTANRWDELFSSAIDCCTSKLWWLDAATCTQS